MAENAPNAWAETWLKGVASGRLTMSQRQVAAVEAHGGVAEVRRIAQRLGVHLARVTDDHGVELVLASRHPITLIC